MGETIKLRAGSEMPAYRTGLIAALDVGSSKTVCLIGRSEPGSLRVIGAALRETQGVRAGTIVNMEHAEESIRDVVAAAEKHADARIQNVLISVNCGQPVSVTSRAAAANRQAIRSSALAAMRPRRGWRSNAGRCCWKSRSAPCAICACAPVSSRRNTLTCCCFPFSYTENAARGKFVTTSPRPFLTDTCKTTSRVSDRNDGAWSSNATAQAAHALRNNMVISVSVPEARPARAAPGSACLR